VDWLAGLDLATPREPWQAAAGAEARLDEGW